MKSRSKPLLFTASIALLLSIPTQSSAINVWNGFAGDNSWFTSGNWYTPSEFDDIVIISQLGVRISGTDSGAATAARLYLGGYPTGNPGHGSINISEGATLNTEYAFLGSQANSHGAISISGSGSRWVSTNSVHIATGGGTGIVDITNGGSFSGGTYAYIGYGIGSSGAVTVSGSGSQWGGNYLINIGMAGGTGTMTIKDNGALTPSFIWLGAEGGTGTLNIGDGGAAGTVTTNTIYSANGKINLNHNEIAYTLASILDGTLSLEQKGSGMTILTKANTYSGGTTVSYGTLLVNNTSGSGLGVGDVDVAVGARLGGNGSFSGSATIDGIYAPGNSIGKLTSGSLVYGATGVYEWEISNATGVAGATDGGWDHAMVNGDLNFDPGSTLRNVSLQLNGLQGLTSDFDASTEYTWLIASVSGEITGWETVSIDLSYFANAYTGNFYLTVDDGELSLVYDAIPEPTLPSLLIGGFATLVSSSIWRRRKGN